MVSIRYAKCDVRNVKCNVQTGVLAVQGLPASVWARKPTLVAVGVSGTDCPTEAIRA